MGAVRFRYALEPVALQRQWALDALLRALGDCNASLRQQRDAHDQVLVQLAQGRQQWLEMGAPGRPLQIDRQQRLSTYLQQRRQAAASLEQACAELEQQREELITQVGAAQRAVDAVEEHKETMRQAFFKAMRAGEFKDADDQWNVLQTVRMTDGD